jgi:hypothetical protein
LNSRWHSGGNYDKSSKVKKTPSITDLARLLANSLDAVRGAPHLSAERWLIEEKTFLIYRAMTSSSRHYHDLSHIFLVAKHLPVLGKIAALYHDIIYFHVDGGFPPNVSERIGDVIDFREHGIFLASSWDESVADVASIFGLTVGQELSPFDGLNEFLSAVLAVRELQPFLGVKDLWAVAACIKATIPFRPVKNGMTPTELLGKRLADLSRGDVHLSAEEIDAMQHLSVLMANADVQSFSKPDLSQFIENTWQLLPETNADFHRVGSFYVGSYRLALQSMRNFLAGLDVNVIFRRHRDMPDDATYQTMLQCSRENLRCALQYLDAHVCTLCVLEGLAHVTGGDGPIAYFTGIGDSEKSPMLEFLKHPVDRASCGVEEKVLHALKGKHATVNRFDHGLSPLAALFYEALGQTQITELLRHVENADPIDWRNFLDLVPRVLLRQVAVAVAKIAIVRKERFEEFIDAAKGE